MTNLERNGKEKTRHNSLVEDVQTKSVLVSRFEGDLLR